MKRNISCFFYRDGCLSSQTPCNVIIGNSKRYVNKSHYNYPHERTLSNKIKIVNHPPSKRIIHSNLLVWYNIIYIFVYLISCSLNIKKGVRKYIMTIRINIIHCLEGIILPLLQTIKNIMNINIINHLMLQMY
jgi:hypothetical protein